MTDWAASSLDAVLRLAELGGRDPVILRKHHRVWLAHPISGYERHLSREIADFQKQNTSDIALHALRGFFHAAAVGEALCDPSLIQQTFGRTLKENYPEASPSFLRFATTYWTLKVLVKQTTDPTLAQYVLSNVEREIGPVFFPTPGPMTIDPADRAIAQRQMIEASGATINILEFLIGNPILLRDRAAQKGCLGAVLAMLGAFGVAVVALLF